MERVVSKETRERVQKVKEAGYAINKTISQKIRQTREEKGISIGRLAKKTGYSQAHISNIELGNRYIRLDVLINLLQAMDAEIEIKI